jgi:hypothetical protein
MLQAVNRAPILQSVVLFAATCLGRMILTKSLTPEEIIPLILLCQI